MIYALRIATSDEPAGVGELDRAARTQAIRDAFGELLVEESLPAANIPAEGMTPEYVLAVHRISGALPLSAVLDAIEGQLGDRSWYRISYHRCHHDEGRPCEPWQVAREGGPAPEGV